MIQFKLSYQYIKQQQQNMFSSVEEQFNLFHLYLTSEVIRNNQSFKIKQNESKENISEKHTFLLIATVYVKYDKKGAG
jgi:hypothetical protein